MSGLYPRNIEQKLGFDGVRQILSDLCQSGLGKSEVEEMGFSSDYREVRRRLNETFEMKRVIESGVDRPDMSLNDLSSWLPGLQVSGSYGSIEEMSALLKSLQTYGRVRAFFHKREGSDEHNGYL